MALTATPRHIVELTDKVLENQYNVFDVKLNWVTAKDVTLSGVEGARTASFAVNGQSVKADVANAKVTIAGKEAKAADLKAGLICDISYLGNNDLSREVTCKAEAK